MKTLLIFSFLALGACAKPPQGAIQTPAPVIYDSCTGSWNATCTTTTYALKDHPEIPVQYFQGQDQFQTKEDFEQVWSVCNFMPCQIQQQGPGPKALPEIGL